MEENPYLGSTKRTPRPTGSELLYRFQTQSGLARDQRLWDAAEHVRVPPQEPLASTYHPDLVTRIRLEYLATAAGTTAEWNRTQDRIIARTLTREAELRRQVGIFRRRGGSADAGQAPS